MNNRGTGKTTQQLNSAPHGAVFVWCNGQIGYPQQLARSLGRTDIQVKPKSWLDSNECMGVRAPVVYDHALCVLSIRALEAKTYLRERQERSA